MIGFIVAQFAMCAGDNLAHTHGQTATWLQWDPGTYFLCDQNWSHIRSGEECVTCNEI